MANAVELESKDMYVIFSRRHVVVKCHISTVIDIMC